MAQIIDLRNLYRSYLTSYQLENKLRLGAWGFLKVRFDPRYLRIPWHFYNKSDEHRELTHDKYSTVTFSNKLHVLLILGIRLLIKKKLQLHVFWHLKISIVDRIFIEFQKVNQDINGSVTELTIVHQLNFYIFKFNQLKWVHCSLYRSLDFRGGTNITFSCFQI